MGFNSGFKGLRLKSSRRAHLSCTDQTWKWGTAALRNAGINLSVYTA